MKRIDDIEKLSESALSEMITVEWENGKEYGTHLIDMYTTANNNGITININKDESVKEIRINNPIAIEIELQSFTNLVVCILNYKNLGFTDDEMHEIGYGITAENGTVGKDAFTLEQRNFKVSYINELSEESKTRNINFSIIFI